LPYLRVANVQDGYLDLTEIKTIIVPQTDKERYLLRAGDVIICEGGDFDKVGRGVIWHGQIRDCLHQNHIFCIRANPALLLPEFLALEIASPYGKRYFLGCAKKTSNLASINSSQVKAFPLLLPSLGEQQAIVDEFEDIGASRRAIAAHADAFRSVLKASVEALT
jgi:type I restriction enzyme, S subunit